MGAKRKARFVPEVAGLYQVHYVCPTYQAHPSDSPNIQVLNNSPDTVYPISGTHHIFPFYTSALNATIFLMSYRGETLF